MDALKRTLGFGAGVSPPSPQRSGQGPPTGAQLRDDALENGVDVRQKILGLWHSMKYGRTLFALDSSHPSSFTGGLNPVWFLGVCYQGRMTSENRLVTGASPSQIERTRVNS